MEVEMRETKTGVGESGAKTRGRETSEAISSVLASEGSAEVRHPNIEANRAPDPTSLSFGKQSTHVDDRQADFDRERALSRRPCSLTDQRTERCSLARALVHGSPYNASHPPAHPPRDKKNSTAVASALKRRRQSLYCARPTSANLSVPAFASEPVT